MIKEFVAIDFETLYPDRKSVCSVGLVHYKDNKPVDSFYSLVQPPWDALQQGSSNFEEIHGIKDSMLLDASDWTVVIKQMEEFCGNLPLCAHNASFEKSCITACCEHYGIETTLNYKIMVDTLGLAREVEKRLGLKINGRGTHTLNTLCEMYNIPSGTHHNALDDCVCGTLYIKLCEILAMSNEERSQLNIVVPEPIIETFSKPGTINLTEIFD